ncbi:hypothetical protein BGW80DRAFT_1228470 [Lactifluus volemus]|nr:hypothetical protein BGW80DRAFT_1228470 [Lactifluus volemus]
MYADVCAFKASSNVLRRSKTKDCYKIPGVPRDCTEADIKKVYRRESLKHQPDKVLIKSHAVLSDLWRRERYDLGEDVR